MSRVADLRRRVAALRDEMASFVTEKNREVEILSHFAGDDENPVPNR